MTDTSSEPQRNVRLARRAFVATTFPVFVCFFLHACALLAETDRDSPLEELAANLVALRYYVHGLFYLGTCGLYANTKGDFYLILLALFYLSLVLCCGILAWKREDVLLGMYLSSLTVSGLAFAWFVYIVRRFDAHLQHCIVEDEPSVPRTRFEGNATVWLRVILVCAAGEVVNAAVQNLSVSDDREAAWVINATIHTCVLPTLGLYAWQKLRNETKESKNALCIYLFNLVLVGPQRMSLLLLSSSIETSLAVVLACLQTVSCVMLLRNFDLSNVTALELDTSDVVDFGDSRRATAFFDLKPALVPCPRFSRASTSGLALGVFLFCLQWNIQGILVTLLQAQGKISNEYLFLGLNSGAHAAVMFGFLYFMITEHIAHHKPRLWFNFTANAGFLILSSVALAYTKSTLHTLVMLGQTITACLTMCALFGVCADRILTQPHYAVIETVASMSDGEADVSFLRRLVAFHLVAIAAGFSVLSGTIVGFTDDPLEVRVESAQEYVFHFAFLLPLLAWTGLLVNHRFNLALSALACLFVLLPYCILNAAVFYVSSNPVFVVVYGCLAGITGSLGRLLYCLRRTLIEANASQGHVVWGKR